MKQYNSIKAMNKIIYLVIVPMIITACGSSKENKENVQRYIYTTILVSKFLRFTYYLNIKYEIFKKI